MVSQRERSHSAPKPKRDIHAKSNRRDSSQACGDTDCSPLGACAATAVWSALAKLFHPQETSHLSWGSLQASSTHSSQTLAFSAQPWTSQRLSHTWTLAGQWSWRLQAFLAWRRSSPCEQAVSCTSPIPSAQPLAEPPCTVVLCGQVPHASVQLGHVGVDCGSIHFWLDRRSQPLRRHIWLWHSNSCHSFARG